MLALIEENISWKEKWIQLTNKLEARVYQDGGETKRMFPLRHLSDEEVLKGFEAVKASLPQYQGFSFNIFPTQGINIPESVLSKMNESEAEAIFRALLPTVEKLMAVHNDMALLQYLLGQLLGQKPEIEIKRATLKGNHFSAEGDQTYVINLYDPKVRGILDPIRDLADTVNKAAKSTLFKGSVHDGGFMVLRITESDMQTLAQSPYLEEIKAIFGDLQGEYSKRQTGTLLGEFRRFAGPYLGSGTAAQSGEIKRLS